MIATWGAAEWFWNVLTLAVGGLVTLFGVFVVVRMVEPRGIRALLRRR